MRTFFNYFSSKEEAVVAAAAAGAEALLAEFRARPGTESVLRALREAVLGIVDQGDAASRDYVKAMRLIRRTPSLVPHQLAVLAAQERRSPTPSPNACRPAPSPGPTRRCAPRRP